MGKKKRLYKNINEAFWAWCIIFLGILLRLHQYLYNRSLWSDEIKLVFNLVNKSFLGLLGPLDYAQGAPIGFLLLNKSLIWLLGSSEYILRIVPLLSGIFSLFVFYKVARYYISQKAALIALVLFAVSDQLIYYSSEVKQYSSDVFIAVLLYFLSIGIQKKDLKTPQIFLSGFLGAIAIWFSHPSIFTLASIGIVLLLSEKNMHRICQLSLIYLFWTISFTTFYFFSLRNLASSGTLLNYWNYAFMPTNNLTTTLSWITTSFAKLFDNPLVLLPLWFSIPVFLWGITSMCIRNKKSFFILALPIFFVLVASGLHKYPFGGRLTLFLIPIFLLFIAEGIYRIISIFRSIKPIAIFIVAILLFNPLKIAIGHILYPRTKEEIKPMLQYIKEHKRPGDKVYIYYGANEAFRYYSKSYNLDKEMFIFGVEARNNWDNYIKDLNRLKGNKRIWIVFSHVCFWVKGDEQRFFVEYLDKIGTRKSSFRIPELVIRDKKSELPGASIYLYELNNEVT